MLLESTKCNVRERRRERKMGRVREKAKCGGGEYEALRKARMLENQARLETLGVANTVSQLRQQQQQQQSRSRSRPYQKKVYGLTPLRRSQRINNNNLTPLQPSTPPLFTPIKQERKKVTLCEDREEEEQRPANAPFINLSNADLLLSAQSSSRRCDSKGRGSVYNPLLGICCHFCRQKKLCGEQDCERCGNFDVNQPCLGKTDCSVCHSSTGVFCRACLKIRYGEEIEEVRKNQGWMCPHCIEANGINPYWICNSSICLRKRKMPPTGIAVYRAREMGYKSVAHLLMEELKSGKCKI